VVFRSPLGLGSEIKARTAIVDHSELTMARQKPNELDFTQLPPSIGIDVSNLFEGATLKADREKMLDLTCLSPLRSKEQEENLIPVKYAYVREEMNIIFRKLQNKVVGKR
jgi:hypothetical protein